MLEKIKKIKSLLATTANGQVGDFKCFIRTNKNLKRQKMNDQHITNFGIQCLNPSYVFKQLMNTDGEKPRSVILTSGTLSPMRIVYTELRTLFRVKLVNEHFIEDERVFATILSSDFAGNKFKFNFENRDMKKSFRDLGRLLFKL